MRTMNRLFTRMLSGWVLAFLCGLPVTETLAAGAKSVPPKPQQIRGSVVSCDEKALILRAGKGEEIKFTITMESRFGEKGAIKSAADFKPGNHVLVTYVRTREGRILKQVVHVVKHIN